MSRPAFTMHQKQLKKELLKKFEEIGAEALLKETEGLKATFQAELASALAVVESTTGDEKRAATIAAKRARKAVQIIVVVEKSVRTLTKSPEQREAERAARAAKKAAAAVATEPVVLGAAPEAVAASA